MEKGLDEALALEVATALTAHDALGAHAEAELGIDPDDISSPLHAAWPRCSVSPSARCSPAAHDDPRRARPADLADGGCVVVVALASPASSASGWLRQARPCGPAQRARRTLLPWPSPTPSGPPSGPRSVDEALRRAGAAGRGGRAPTRSWRCDGPWRRTAGRRPSSPRHLASTATSRSVGSRTSPSAWPGGCPPNGVRDRDRGRRRVPHVGRARVLWAGLDLDDPGAPSSTGWRPVAAAASRAGIAVDGQRFRPHVTPARPVTPPRSPTGSGCSTRTPGRGGSQTGSRWWRRTSGGAARSAALRGGRPVRARRRAPIRRNAATRPASASRRRAAAR